MLRALMVIIPVAMAVYAVVDCVQTDDDAVRGLPKLAWVAIILFFPLAGSLAWFFGGRPRSIAAGGPGWLPGNQGRPGPGAGGGPHIGRDRPRGPDDDPDFLKGL